MAELKTKPTAASVTGFINAIEDDQIRKDSKAISVIMSKITKAKPKIWGSDIVGFGSYHYRYASGQEGDWMLTGFAPRTKEITLYIMPGFDGQAALMKKLGPYSGGLSCVYIKRLSDLHLPTLKKLIDLSVRKLIERSTPAK
jgi:uncharacterized protein DUF1801